MIALGRLIILCFFGIVYCQPGSSLCKKKLVEQISQGQLVSYSLVLSGQYLNELGSYSECSSPLYPTQKYYLQVIQVSNQSADLSNKFVRGTCVLKECDPSITKAFEIFLGGSPVGQVISSSQVTYIDPNTAYQNIVNIYTPGFYVMYSFFFLLLFLNLLGIIVQYTSFGNVQFKKKNLQIQFQTDKEGREHYIELLAQIDKLLLNRKKIWAIFFLCFSIPRNLIILFYDTEKSRKVGFMRFLKVIGFIWISFDVTFYVAFMTYPTNFYDYPYLSTNAMSVILISGIIYGFSLVYFWTGFAVMHDRLQSIYLKKQNYSVFLFITKTYLYYVIPVGYITAIMATVFPFMGSGPIYSQIAQDFFLGNCSQYWWTNILLINNYVPWSYGSLCGYHLTYIANEFQMIALLIPLFIFVYRHTFRKGLGLTFLIVTICASVIPIVYMTLKYDVNGYPGFNSNAYDNLIFRIYFRIPPFLIGIALAIFQFEYKYVDKLNDGQTPYHKSYLEKIREKRLFHLVCYLVGTVLLILPVLILLNDVKCVSKGQQTFPLSKLTYCWGSGASAVYNVLGQYVFFAGLVLILLPIIINRSEVLKPLMSSHLWHLMEELTFAAFLIQFILVTWYFGSREQNVLLSMRYLAQITFSSCILSYLIAIPFYLLVERPFKNFLDLILFPKSSIFKKEKDLDDEETDSESEEDLQVKDKIDGPIPNNVQIQEEVTITDNTNNMSTIMNSNSAVSPAIDHHKVDKKGKKKMKPKCRYCQGDESAYDCQCDCLISKKTCKCVLKIIRTDQLRGSSSEYTKSNLRNSGLMQRIRQHDINRTLDQSRLTNNQSEKKVSFA